MLAYWFADYHVAEMDVTPFSPCWNTTAYADKQTESQVSEGVPYLCHDHSRRVVSRGVYACDDNVMSVDAAECVDIMVIGWLWEALVFAVQHLYGSDLLDLQRADPGDSIVVMNKSLAVCLHDERALAERKGLMLVDADNIKWPRSLQQQCG